MQIMDKCLLAVLGFAVCKYFTGDNKCFHFTNFSKLLENCFWDPGVVIRREGKYLFFCLFSFPLTRSLLLLNLSVQI